MEELKILVEMVAKLPQMALWVVIMFFIYKTLIIGSIFGLVRFTVAKLHDWKVNGVRNVNITTQVKNITISGSDVTVMEALTKCAGRRSHSGMYVHYTDAQWLLEAVNEKITKDTIK